LEERLRRMVHYEKVDLSTLKGWLLNAILRWEGTSITILPRYYSDVILLAHARVSMTNHNPKEDFRSKVNQVLYIEKYYLNLISANNISTYQTYCKIYTYRLKSN